MSYISKKLGTGLVCLSTALFSASTWATLVTTEVSGTVLDAASNSYGLGVGDSVSLELVYDDSLVAATGASSIALDDDPTFGLTFEFGNTTFVETDDIDFGDPFFGPELFFNDGELTGISFITDPTVDSSLEVRDFASGLAFFDLFDLNTFDTIIYGEFDDLSLAVTTPVGGGGPTAVSAAPTLGLFTFAFALISFSRRHFSRA